MIFAIVGKSGVGKTTIIDKMGNVSSMPPRVVQTTTRPKRFGEIEGKTYHFKDFKEINLDKFATYQMYAVANGDLWFYGYERYDIEKFLNCVLVASPKEVEMLRANYGKDNIYVIELVAPIKTRVDRCFARDNINKETSKEIARRLASDEVDFRKLVPNASIENTKSIEDTLQKVCDEILAVMYKDKKAKPSKRIIFYTGTMRSGKSATLIERIQKDIKNRVPFVALKSSLDTRHPRIKSRNGSSVDCIRVSSDVDIYDLVVSKIENNNLKEFNVYIDEVQFLSVEQISQLYELVRDIKFLKVYCSGLLVDYKGDFFEATRYLIPIADEIVKIPHICECCGTRNATHHVLMEDGKPTIKDLKFIVGDREFLSTCHPCWVKKHLGKER